MDPGRVIVDGVDQNAVYVGSQESNSASWWCDGPLIRLVDGEVFRYVDGGSGERWSPNPYPFSNVTWSEVSPVGSLDDPGLSDTFIASSRPWFAVSPEIRLVAAGFISDDLDPLAALSQAVTILDTPSRLGSARAPAP